MRFVLRFDNGGYFAGMGVDRNGLDYKRVTENINEAAIFVVSLMEDVSQSLAVSPDIPLPNNGWEIVPIRVEKV